MDALAIDRSTVMTHDRAFGKVRGLRILDEDTFAAPAAGAKSGSHSLKLRLVQSASRSELQASRAWRRRAHQDTHRCVPEGEREPLTHDRRKGHGSLKPTSQWEPSQNGLFFEAPQRHSV